MQFKIPLWEHQLRALQEADPHQRDCFALFFEQGTGKTATAINIIRRIIDKEKHLPLTLVLCPPAVIENWKREILAHSDIAERDILCLDDSQWHRLCLTDSVERGNHHKVLITNYESLNMEKLFARLKKIKPQVIVADESQKLKDISAKRTKRAIELSKTAKYRYILSGTPILNSAFDIFSQYLFLDQGTSFSSNLHHFRNTYFNDKNAHRPKQTYFPDWQLKPGALEAINKLIYKRAARAVKEECLDLPPLVRQTIECDMADEQLSMYRAMEKDCIAYVGEVAATAQLAMLQAMRLLQIASGFVRMEDKTNHVFHSNPKDKALSEVLQQLPKNEKVIIWSVFKENYESIGRVLHTLRMPYVEVHGGVPQNRKQANIDDFNRRPAIRALVGHPQSCGIGVNLTAASYMVYYSRTHSLENDLQSEARNYRGGSERHTKVTRIDIVARNSIDELVLLALADKQDVSEVILNHLRRRK